MALVLSLGLVTAVPVMALSLTSVVPLPCTAGASANYTISLTNAVALNASTNIYVYFPDADATTLAGVSGATIDGTPTGAITKDKYNVTDLYDNVLIIPPAGAVAPSSHVLVVQNVTNLCGAGAHTLTIWTTVEPTEVDGTYTLCAGSLNSIVITPDPATGKACVNSTFTVTAYDACGNSLGAVTATWATNGSNQITDYGNNIVYSCNATVQNLTATSGALTDWVLWTVSVGDVASLGVVSDPGPGSYPAGSPILATVNATDCCGNLIPGVDITASLVGTGTLSGTTTQTTDASGLAAFNLSICQPGTGYILTFTGSTAVNSTAFDVVNGAATKLCIYPNPATTTCCQNVTLVAMVNDACGNNISTPTSAVNFSIVETGDNGTWYVIDNYTSIYHGSKAGTWTVKATNGTYEGTGTLTVTHGACVNMTVTPAEKTITYRETATFKAMAVDACGNSFDISDQCTWTCTDTGATVADGVVEGAGTGCCNVTATCTACTGINSGTACLSVRPSMCFIATAAYGTPMAEEIQILREFRDGYLLTSPLGRALVAFYYKTSPPIAQFIAEHPVLQLAVRVMLVPALAMSTIAVNSTLAMPITILSLLLASIALAAWATRRRERRGPSYA